MRIGRRLRSLVAASAAAFVVACGAAGCSSPAFTSGTSLQAGTGTSWYVDTNATFGTVSFAIPNTPVPLPSGPAPQAVVAFLAQYSSVFGMQDPPNEWQLVDTEQDDLGFQHLRFVQMNRGVQVYPGSWRAAIDPNGNLASMAGTYVPDAGSASITPKKTSADAVSAAVADVASRVPGIPASSVDATSGTMAIYAAQSLSPTLAYDVHTEAFVGAAGDLSDYVIDAQTGAILEREDAAETAQTAQGYGAPHYAPFNVIDSMVTFPATGKGGTLSLRGTTTNGVAIQTGTQTKQIIAGGPANAWVDSTLPKGAAITSQATFATVVAGYGKTFGRSSFDGKGREVDIQINANQVGNINAFFDPTGGKFGRLAGSCGGGFGVGDGDPTMSIYPLATSQDVIAHEFGHGVSSCSWGGGYSGLTGGVNEAMSDILGELVSGALQGSHPTLIGRDISPQQGVHLRNLSKPHDATNLWGMQTCDRVSELSTCGTIGSTTLEMHLTSGVVTYAWFLMTFGGTHESTHVVVPCGLGWSASSQLWYQIETKELPSNPDFKAVANASLSAAKKRKLNPQPVACAWVATEVLKASDVKSQWGVTCPGAPDAGSQSGSQSPFATGGAGAAEAGAPAGTDAGGVSLTSGSTALTECTNAPINEDAGTLGGGQQSLGHH